MLSLRLARKKVKKEIYLLKFPNEKDHQKEDTMFPTEHSKAVQVMHDYLSEEQIGQGISNIRDNTPRA